MLTVFVLSLQNIKSNNLGVKDDGYFVLYSKGAVPLLKFELNSPEQFKISITNMTNELGLSAKQISNETLKLWQFSFQNPEMPEAFAEERDEQRDEIQQIFNPTVGRYDVTIDTGPSYQTQRQEAAANLNEIAARNPQIMGIAGDLIMQAQDFPMADKLAERLAKTIPPQLMDDDDQPQLPPQVMQQLQQMDQVIQQMTAENQALQAELQSKEADRQAKLAAEAAKIEQQREAQEQDHDVDVYKAETERIKAVGDIDKNMSAPLEEI